MNSIPTTTISEELDEHLKIPENYRIIFSGKFGVGKTYFLNAYFDSREKQYNKITISPVNYVVASNEDIFELIKADILKELLITGKVNIDSLPTDTTVQKISNFVEDNPFFLIDFLAKTLSKISPLLAFQESLVSAIKEIGENYKKTVSKRSTDNKSMSQETGDYLDEMEAKLGNIYEHNYVTRVINIFLKGIRGGKKNVLIIDDLDRIDPEHIFRILNILSAHNNQFREANKFEFDHVFLVCDIDNIRKIFSHRYGSDVDFEGYLDKFYSTDVFYINNKNAIKSYVRDMLPKAEDQSLNIAAFLLEHLIEGNHLTIRKLLKHKIPIPQKITVLHEQNKLEGDIFFMIEPPRFLSFERIFFDTSDLKILNLFKLMSIVYGDFKTFYNSLIELKNISLEIDFLKVEDILKFLALQYHLVSKNGDDLFVEKIYYNEGGRNRVHSFGPPMVNLLKCQYRLHTEWSLKTPYAGESSYFSNVHVVNETSFQTYNNNSSININISEIFGIIIEIAELCQQKGYLEKAGIYFSFKGLNK